MADGSSVREQTAPIKADFPLLIAWVFPRQALVASLREVVVALG